MCPLMFRETKFCTSKKQGKRETWLLQTDRVPPSPVLAHPTWPELVLDQFSKWLYCSFCYIVLIRQMWTSRCFTPASIVDARWVEFSWQFDWVIIDSTDTVRVSQHDPALRRVELNSCRFGVTVNVRRVTVSVRITTSSYNGGADSIRSNIAPRESKQ